MKGITRSALAALTAWSIVALAAPSAPSEFAHHPADDWINSAPLTLAFCLIGRDGRLYGSVPGEMHVGDERAKRVEGALDQLLSASAQ